MTALRRPPSPLAHGPADTCRSCRDCPSCDGGTAYMPDQYRIEQRLSVRPGIALHAVCTRCNGSGTTCLNLRPEEPA